MKKISIVLFALLLMVIGGLFWLRHHLDDLVRDAIAKYGSAMTQAKVTLDGVNIRASDGETVIHHLNIGNPKGFKADHAFKVDAFAVAVEPKTLTGNVITIKKILIVAPDVVLEQGASMTNFDAIQNNIQAYLDKQLRDKNADSDHASKPGRKLIVEELTIREARARAATPFIPEKMLTITLPDITVRNLGQAEGGLSPGELGQRIVGILKKELGSAISLDK